MFNKLIEKKRDEWFDSQQCTICELIKYIEDRNIMRDAQYEAIKTYLFLKIACHNKPLWQLFSEGAFNTLNIDNLELNAANHQLLSNNKAAAALLEYSRLKDKNNVQVDPQLEKYIMAHLDTIDYERVFKELFYNISYTDYIFSLPMGAGKTYLMAAFIYLNLYYALNEPENPDFAHNFIVFAPSGLKSSIVPSLKNIREFDPTWILPNPTAEQIKKLIKFEVLDEQKTAQKSNLVRNPNAQKINSHQPFEDLMGLVAIVNAEKVIIDRVDESEKEENFYSREEYQKIKIANELRDIIGKLPNLGIFIDEIQHAADNEIKLRKVVSHWAAISQSFNSVLGFSGTPYLEKAKGVNIGDDYVMSNKNLANVVYYYPLIEGIDNFLKIPTVKYEDRNSDSIIENGITEFMQLYKDKIYDNGTCAKLAIYCPTIENLEDVIYPQTTNIIGRYGLTPDAILKYHRGNKSYPQPEGAESEFASLDTPVSHIRIVLLVQIGKEGWDCKSLTGVILSQQRSCPTNMVLQTSCRCLRQVEKGAHETALIWLNKFNADKLNTQLKKEQRISLSDFSSVKSKPTIEIKRYSRMEKLRVPPIDFYQLKVKYTTVVEDIQTEPSKCLEKIIANLPKPDKSLIYQQDLTGKIIRTDSDERTDKELTTYREWLYTIVKESFGTLPFKRLISVEKQLHIIFEEITLNESGCMYLNGEYDQQRIRSLIRQVFIPTRSCKVDEEIVPQKAELLQIEKLTSPLSTNDDSKFYPSQKAVETIIECDNFTLEQIESLSSMPENIRNSLYPERAQTYHYLPYHFDSSLERDYLKSALPLINGKPLEIYFNGDDTLTEFAIDCYRQTHGNWSYIGKYYPDFLLISRKPDSKIDRAIIIETKGEGFAPKFTDKHSFMCGHFIKQNNDKFGYRRFDYLYLEDTLTKEQRERKTLDKITEFFQN